MRKRCRPSGKVKFKTHEAAAKRAGEILVRSDTTAWGTYHCPACGHWHLTGKEFRNDQSEFSGLCPYKRPKTKKKKLPKTPVDIEDLEIPKKFR